MAPDDPRCWPALPLAQWADTCATVHRWSQVVGKVKLGLTPLVNHWWNVTLFVDARGLTTGAIPYRGRTLTLRFDFIDHALALESDAGVVHRLPLRPQSVAAFYTEFMATLARAGIDVAIWRMPVEIPDPVPFDEDFAHASYDRHAVERFFRVLLSVDRVFREFRAAFIGKCSPVQFFWGSFDLAVTRFSGRRAPAREGADAITREAYSHEVSSVGFWPGEGYDDAAFYSYTAPEPAGFRDRAGMPNGTFYDTKLGEYIVMYDHVRNASSPSEALLAFCRATYEAGADLAGWDRAALER
ncbi:MAG TPA: DUF5996 family protein [Casimicrobiaceae bacterium]|nr:DUF5996 family protein [Casimicrobiaceae bacterium]